MKKTIIFILAFSIAVSLLLVACSNNTGKVTDANSSEKIETTSQLNIETTTIEETIAITTEKEETISNTEPLSTTKETEEIETTSFEKPVFEELDMDKILNHEKIPLWGEGEAPFEIKEDKVRAKFYQVASIQAYLVPGSDECIIVYPGGGYAALTASEAGEIAKAYNEKGISAFVCNYRLNQYTDEKLGYIAYHRDAFLSDGQRAVQFVRYYASAFDIDPNKIGVIGFSAGGHLAMYVCEHECEENYKNDEIGKVSSKPNLCILSYAVTVLKDGISRVTTQHFFHSQAERADNELISFYSYTYAPEKMPPTYIWYSEKDSSVDYNVCSVAFAKKLTELGIVNKLDGFKDGGHGVGLAKGYSDCSKWLDNSVEFINQIFGE